MTQITMTPQIAQERITEIKRAAYERDNEAAHAAEDRLREDVLEAIAKGTCEHAVECARLAMTTEDIDFARWYA